jgi:hypothetical protein
MSFNLPITIDKATHIVVYHQDPPVVTSDSSNELAEIRNQIHDLAKDMTALTSRIMKIELCQPLPRKSPFFAPAIAPEPSGLEVRRLSEAIPVDTTDSKTAFEKLVKNITPPVKAKPVAKEEVKVVVEEVVEEEEEEEAMELEEFEYKGLTYYRDGENQVYQKDDDDDLDDTPIGVWNEDKKKIIKYAKA